MKSGPKSSPYWAPALAAALIATGAPWLAAAADHEAGAPLSQAEAGGAWMLESGGRDLCTVTLGSNYAASADRPCATAFDGAPTAWRPTADGMELVSGDGKALMSFGRWSNSLFVAHRADGVDVQLRRGEGAATSQ